MNCLHDRRQEGVQKDPHKQLSNLIKIIIKLVHKLIGRRSLPATGDPDREFGLVAGVTIFTHPLVLKSQNLTVLSY